MQNMKRVISWLGISGHTYYSTARITDSEILSLIRFGISTFHGNNMLEIYVEDTKLIIISCQKLRRKCGVI